MKHFQNSDTVAARKVALRNFASLAVIAAAVTASPLAAQVTDAAQVPTITEAAPQAAAEPATTGAQSSRGSISDDIVVTARRTEERLQNVPVAVTAFGTEQLTERRILTESDLQSVTPGLTVRQSSSSNQLSLSLRGQSIDAYSYSAPAVLTYFNEVQQGGVTATSFFDLQSIQVVKGPQGTLFGRNATGGAVLYQTQAPTRNFEGYGRAGYGNYDNRELEGAINVPLGTFGAFRVSGKLQKRDGFQHNLYNGGRLNSVDSQVIRGSLLIAPEGSGFENKTVYQHGFFGGNSGGIKLQNFYTPGQTNNGNALNATAAALYPAGFINFTTDARVRQLGFDGIADYLQKQQKIGFYDFYNDADGRHRAKQDTVSNTTSFDLSDNLVIKNIFGYNNVVSRDKSDVDGSPFQIVTLGAADTMRFNYVFRTRQVSDELQLQGKAFDEKLSYIFGLFGSKETQGQQALYNIGGDYPQPGPAGAPFQYNFKSIDKSRAVFGQATYAVAPELNVTLGGRYTWEKIRIEQLPGDLYQSIGIGPRSEKFSKPSWNVGIDYHITDSLMVYANHRGSWRTGGFNGTSLDTIDGVMVPNAFKPETTYDFEIGAKFAGQIGGLPARFNVALYDQYVKNVQRTVYIAVTAVSGNVAKARVTGAELDGQITLASWLQVGGAFNYTNARYTDPDATVGNFTLAFGPYGDTPKYSGSAYVRASADLPNGNGEVVARGDLYAQSGNFYTNLNDSLSPGTRIPSYALLNGRLEWNDIAGSRISAAAYIRNITDKKYYAGGLGLGAVVGTNGTLTGMPRMYGAEVSFKF
ncbi:TonB-dependent receptor [Sphingobium aromaticiconvertens]|uniref:TonB-dependent receptor n=1 Tax=Sphingobium aromaticiconvertens TaxID=365341 RepID=UPI003017D39A